MAFSRQLIKSILGEGATDEKVQSIIDAHLEVVNPIKEERDNLKEKAGKADDLQKEIDKLKAEGGDLAKVRDEYAAYKKQVEERENAAAVKSAYRKLLTEEKVSEKRLDSILKLTDFSKMKLDKDGNLEDADKLKESIKTEWSDFIVSTSEKGAAVENPPQTGKTKMTKEQILAIKDTSERQKAIAENHEVFGF